CAPLRPPKPPTSQGMVQRISKERAMSREGAAMTSGPGALDPSGDHSFDLAVCAGHLTVPSRHTPLHRALAICPPQLGAPRIQNNSGLPQGPASGSVVG